MKQRSGNIADYNGKYNFVEGFVKESAKRH